MTPTPDIVFDDLLLELKKEGFSLSLHDPIEFTVIFNQYSGDKENFKYFIAPIVCRNKEEQEKFYEIYDRLYVRPSLPGRPAVVRPPLSSYFNEPWSLRALLKNFLFWVCFLLLTGGGVKLRMLLLRRHTPPAVVAPAKPDSVQFELEDAVAKRPEPVFVAKPLKPHMDSGELKSVVQPRGVPIEKQNTVHSSAFAWLVVLGLACLGASTSFFPQKKSKFLPEVDLDTRRGDDAPVDIPMLPKDDLVQKLPVLSRVARDLVRPTSTGIYQLDIKRTIRESVHNYGLLAPVYKDLERRPEYLVLIDRRHPLLSPLFRCLVRTFIRDAVPIHYYFFEDAGRFFAEGSQTAIGFHSLKERHSNTRLIIMGDGNPFLDPEGDLSHWDNKIFLTPASADIENLLHLANLFHREEPLLTAGGTGYESVFFDPEDMDALREYLDDDDLFQWVCAIAVYPSVKWEVIIAVGTALLTESKTLYKLNYTNLLKVARIGWLNGRMIPHEVRVNLLKRLYIHSEIITRKKILELLKESDELIASDHPAYHERLLQLYTQSFVLYANDVRRNKEYEQDAKKFLSIWDKRAVPDLATVVYLRNQDKQWETPVRSTDNAARTVGPNKFLNELLALRVISDPRIRTYFRNAGVSCFALLLLLFLFKDTVQGWGVNKVLGLVDRDYLSSRIVVQIPVTDCLKKRVSDGRLTVTLNNYDNNRYSKTISIVDKDSVSVAFDDITMSDKPPERETFQLILNNSLTIPCTYKEFYPQYDLLLQGVDCMHDLHPDAPHYEKAHPDALTQ